MKKLYRSRKQRVLAGVCGGIAEYFNVDPVLVRIVAVLLFFGGGASLIAYIIGIFIIPEAPYEAEERAGDDPAGNQQEKDHASLKAVEKQSSSTPLAAGIIMIVLGVIFLSRNLPFFNQYYWWFWRYGWDFFWPGALIAMGLLIIVNGSRR